jgi:hypothetical protein
LILSETFFPHPSLSLRERVKVRVLTGNENGCRK